MKLTKEKQNEILVKKRILNTANKTLKSEFIGLDGIIDELINIIEPWFFFPGFQIRPLVVNLWGLSGVGKTALVNRLAELIGFGEKYLHFDIGKYCTSSARSNGFSDDMENYLHNHENNSVMMCMDEFQLGRTLDQEGEEIDRDSLRILWELLDTGKFQYYESYRGLDAFDLYFLQKKLEKCIKLNVKVKNGKVISGKETFLTIFEEEIDIRSIPNNFNKKNSWFIPYTYCNDISVRWRKEFADAQDVTEHISKMNGVEIIAFVEDLYIKLGKPMDVNFSKSVIFVIGNLDEAYRMANNMNPDMSPDEFYEASLKIKLPQIKKALQQRFRNEQIARLGNNHIIYPAFSEKMFSAFIRLEMDKISRRINQECDLKTTFDKSVYNLIYKESVFPTQGTRPILSTIRGIIEPIVTKMMSKVFLAKVVIKRSAWLVQKDRILIRFCDDDNNILMSEEYKLQLKIESLRKSDNLQAQAHTSVHEVGHAILAALLFRIIPDEIISWSIDAEIEGFCKLNLPEGVVTKKVLFQRVVILLGGYAAEKIIFGNENTSTGVQNDIARATSFAMSAVKELGMGSEQLFVQTPCALGDDSYVQSKYFEEQGRRVIKSAMSKAEEILSREKFLLLKMAKHLTKNRKMGHDKIKEFITNYASEEWVTNEGFIEPKEYFNFREMIDTQLAEYNSLWVETKPSKKLSVRK